MCQYTLLPEYKHERRLKNIHLHGCKLLKGCEVWIEIGCTRGNLSCSVIFHNDGSLLWQDNKVELSTLDLKKISCLAVPYEKIVQGLDPIKTLCEYLETIFVQNGTISITLLEGKAELCLRHPIYEARTKIPLPKFMQFFERDDSKPALQPDVH